MLNSKKIIVVLPAYNAENTLEKTYSEIPLDIVDKVILVDDYSHDNTVAVAKKLGIHTVVHTNNKGYGANQKTCYENALKLGADIVVMVHPDYQYTPKLVIAMASMLAYDVYDAVIASRILRGSAQKGRMPIWRYYANRMLTFCQNLLINEKVSEYHTGYRAFNKKVLTTLPLHAASDDFIFDNQMLVQLLYFKFRLGEISCPTSYHKECSSISFNKSVVYGFSVLWTSLLCLLQKLKLIDHKLFDKTKNRLNYLA